MTPIAKKQANTDPTHIGEYAADQPVSGVKIVQEAFSANGFGTGNYVHVAKTEKPKMKA